MPQPATEFRGASGIGAQSFFSDESHTAHAGKSQNSRASAAYKSHVPETKDPTEVLRNPNGTLNVPNEPKLMLHDVSVSVSVFNKCMTSYAQPQAYGISHCGVLSSATLNTFTPSADPHYHSSQDFLRLPKLNPLPV